MSETIELNNEMILEFECNIKVRLDEIVREMSNFYEHGEVHDDFVKISISFYKIILDYKGNKKFLIDKLESQIGNIESQINKEIKMIYEILYKGKKHRSFTKEINCTLEVF